MTSFDIKVDSVFLTEGDGIKKNDELKCKLDGDKLSIEFKGELHRVLGRKSISLFRIAANGPRCIRYVFLGPTANGVINMQVDLHQIVAMTKFGMYGAYTYFHGGNANQSGGWGGRTP